MNADSSGPRRSGEGPPPSIRAYWRRLPCFSCSARTSGVKTRDPKLCAIDLLLSAAGLDRRPCLFDAGTMVSDSASVRRVKSLALENLAVGEAHASHHP